MRSIVKKAMRDEKGAALVLTLVLLLVGGLVIAPLLGFMGTGIIAGEVHEKRMDELYAADAGVEDAIWMIQNAPPSSYPYSYPDPLSVNDKSVQVEIDREQIGTGCPKVYRCRISSTATGTDGSSTVVEAYLSVLYTDFSALLDHAIVSYDTITIQPGTYVDGDVWLPDEEDLNNKGEISGDVKDEDDVSITWPTSEQLSAYYSLDVEGAPDPGPSIDIKHTRTIEPCDREGSLTVDNTGPPETLVLEGTVYVHGDLTFEQPGASMNYTVNLNGQTIFVEGDIYFPPKQVTVTGSGCIIAVGEVWFQPIMNSNPDDFVLIMSTEDTVRLNPSGDFAGCIAGNVEVQLQPGNDLKWITPEGKGLNFPMGDVEGDEKLPISELGIESWQIELVS